MSELIRLGAINKKTNQYTKPSHANKQDEFICIDCGNDVIIRQGKIRIHHFAHCKEDIKCNFYNRNVKCLWPARRYCLICRSF